MDFPLEENRGERRNLNFLLVCFLILPLFIACEEWDKTSEISHISYLPEFHIEGGEFVSVLVADSGEYEDPGATATVNGNEVQVFSIGSVDLTEVGVYVIAYYAENSDELYTIAERFVAVTHNDVSKNDFSGTYEGTIWSPMVESKVKKIDSLGLYKCEEIMGFPGFEMPGRFIDLGKNEIVLLHGEGYFGSYGASEGESTRSTLSWTIKLLDEPYTGTEIPVVWRKKE